MNATQPWGNARFVLVLWMLSNFGHSACSSRTSCAPISEFEYSPGCKGTNALLEQRDCGEATLIALVDQHTFYSSTDHGETWQKSNRENLYPFGITDFGCPPHNRNVRYRMINEKGLPFPVGPEYIEKSEDGGKTWTRKTGILKESGATIKPRGEIYFDPRDENTIYVGPILIDDDNAKEAFCVSHDGGDTFSVLLSIKGRLFAVSRSNPDVIYAADDECSVYKSVDAGKNWAVIMSGPDIRKAALNSAIKSGILKQGQKFRGGKCRALSVDPNESDVVYAVTEFGILRTTDGGMSWCGLKAAGLAGAISQLLIDQSDSNRLFLGTDCGLFRSVNGGGSWRRVDFSQE